jgi:hypothetical protein
VQLADVIDIDLEVDALSKLKKNAVKYPLNGKEETSK